MTMIHMGTWEDMPIQLTFTPTTSIVHTNVTAVVMLMVMVVGVGVRVGVGVWA